MVIFLLLELLFGSVDDAGYYRGRRVVLLLGLYYEHCPLEVVMLMIQVGLSGSSDLPLSLLMRKASLRQ